MNWFSSILTTLALMLGIGLVSSSGNHGDVPSHWRPLGSALSSHPWESTFEKGMSFYETGRFPEALKMFRLAADEGDVNAMLQLGLMCEFGRGVPADYTETRNWFEKAANLGDSRAQYLLGHMHEYGEGMPVDMGTAFSWYHKAAKKGEADAQFSVGRFYLNGILSAPDLFKAEKWLKRAADQCHEQAGQLLSSRFGQSVQLKTAARGC